MLAQTSRRVYARSSPSFAAPLWILTLAAFRNAFRKALGKVLERVLRDYARGAKVARKVPEPVECDAQAAADADEEVNVCEPPHPPSDPAPKLESLVANYRLVLADGREAAHVHVAERCRRRLAMDAAAHEFPHIFAHLLGGRGNARHRAAVRVVHRGGVADRKDLGVVRHRKVRLDLDAPRLVGRRGDPAVCDGRLDAGGPEDGRARDGLVASDDAVYLQVRHRLVQLDFDAEVLERALGIRREIFWEGAKDACAGLDEDDACVACVNLPELVRKCAVRHLRNGARQLDARRPTADDGECHERLAQLRIGDSLCKLEPDEQASAHGRGVAQRLEPRGDVPPLVVPKERVACAGREDECIVRDGICLLYISDAADE